MRFLDRLFVSWMEKEKALIITEEYEIKGWVYNPGLSRSNRFFSNLLNSANKNFLAIKDCEVTYKKRHGEVEKVDFIQLNMKYIVLIRPLKEDDVIG